MMTNNYEYRYYSTLADGHEERYGFYAPECLQLTVAEDVESLGAMAAEEALADWGVFGSLPMVLRIYLDEFSDVYAEVRVSLRVNPHAKAVQVPEIVEGSGDEG